MPAIKSVYWCFTLNFSGERPKLKFDNSAVSYACWQHERSSHDHIQGYLQMKGCRTLNQVRKVFGDLKPRLEKQRARRTDEARDYCLKKETRVAGPWEFGEYVPSGSHQRRFREMVEKSPKRMAEENPSVYRRVMAKMQEEKFKASSLEVSYSNLRSWQKKLQDIIDKEPDSRSIIWVYGPDGGEGKSTFARDLYRKGWFYTRGGGADNVAYQYIGSTKNVVFDVPRDKKDYLQYSLIEMFKDRMIVSNKYEPIMYPLLFSIHVVVMCNFLPDYEKISEDRIYMISCKGNK